MPPRKAAAASAATKPTSDDAKACSLILNYLVAQNRPFSATDISSNLHNAVAKARTDKLLKEMFERGEIAGRASGKQWVFWGLQVGFYIFGFRGKCGGYERSLGLWGWGERIQGFLGDNADNRVGSECYEYARGARSG
jgi:hypothetical protein